MTVQEYLKLPYKIILQEKNDESGHYYYATVAELKGCMSDGETVEEAYKNIYDAMELHIECMLDENMEIPLPETHQTEKYSGKFLTRVPKELHAELVRSAQEQGVSLNQLVLYKLTK
jgi:predicted RNase H-like HicB family nuclease